MYIYIYTHVYVYIYTFFILNMGMATLTHQRLGPIWQERIMWIPMGDYTFLPATMQLNERSFQSICPSICLSHLCDNVSDIVSWNFQEWLLLAKVRGLQKVRGQARDPTWLFPYGNSSLNSPMATKFCTKLELALKRCYIIFSRSSVKFQGHTGQKSCDLNLAMPDRNFSLNSQMVMQWCTKLELALNMCPVFQGHPSNFKVTRGKKVSILSEIHRFRTVTSVWIHRWLRNDAQSLN